MLAIRDASGWRVAAAATALVATAVVAQPEPAPHHVRRLCVETVKPPPEPPLPTRAILHTTKGTITCALAHETPKTVANFAQLARNHFYDGLIFHRVVPGFIIQGGDPTGTGTGGPGYEFADEIAPQLEFDRPGVLAMANRGKDTNGSQFFITEQPARHLDGTSTIFGQCMNLDVIHAIASVPRSLANDRPDDPVVMTVTVE